MNQTKGPDRVAPAQGMSTTKADGYVKLGVGTSWPDNFTPISVPSMLRKAAKTGGDHPALVIKRDGVWKRWSYTEYLQQVELVAKAMIKLGLQPRHGVGIIGFNSPEWFMAELGAIFAGGLAAGIYPTNSPDACKYIMENCQANILVVEDEKQLAKFLPFKDELQHLKAIIQFSGEPSVEGVLSWHQILEMGRKESDVQLNQRLESMAINECCFLVYTSGTTGLPKGVMISHDNLTFTSRLLCEIFHMKEKEERLVSFLPLSHMAANMCDVFAMMYSVGTVTFGDKNALKGTLTCTLKEALPTVFFGVPRVWEKIHEKMLEVGRQSKGLKKQIGTWAKKTGLEHNRNLLNGASGSGSIQYLIANTIVFKQVKRALGLNKCQRFFSGAAPISKDILEYFLSLDIRIMEMYGMSESSGPHLNNTLEQRRTGTVGKETPGFHNKIEPLVEHDQGVAKGGEICAKGRHIMMGYLSNPEKTEEVFDQEGWIRSGDVGYQDEDGFVTITGRIKELIITAGGENIPPVLIENTIKRFLPCLSNVMVIGDKRKFLSCFLTLKVEVDQDTLEPKDTLAPFAIAWCQDIGSKATTVNEALADELVSIKIQEGIDKANAEAISNAQRIQKWSILPKDFSVPGGELGPTLKIMRHVVLKKYESRVEKFYIN